MSNRFCVECGAAHIPGSRFCGECGTAQVAAPPPAAPPPAAPPPAAPPPAAPPPSPPAPPQWRPDAVGAPAPATPATPAMYGSSQQPGRPASPGAIAGLPLELCAAIALLALPAAWLMVRCLLDLRDAGGIIAGAEYGILDAFSDDFGGGARLGLYLLAVIGAKALIGLLLAGVAWLAAIRDRSARPLVLVLAAALLSESIFDRVHQLSMFLALVAVAGAAAILWFAPAARSAFAGRTRAPGARPASITAALLCVPAFTVFYVLAGVIRLIPPELETKQRVVAVLLILLALAMTAWVPGLMRGLSLARVGATVVAGLGFLVPIVVGDLGGFGFTFPLRGAAGLLPGLALGIVALLWAPDDARVFFGGAPINWQGLTSGAGTAGGGPQPQPPVPGWGPAPPAQPPYLAQGAPPYSPPPPPPPATWGYPPPPPPGPAQQYPPAGQHPYPPAGPPASGPA